MKLQVRDATFAYPGSREVFRGLSFDMTPNEVFCLLGPNGTGKSTLLQCLDGLLPLASGKILLDGQDLSRWGRREIARRVAFIPQNHVPVFPFTALEVALLGRTPHLGIFGSPGKRDQHLAEEALDRLGVLSLRDRPYTDISGGESQLVLLASVLAQQAELLLLDEPTAHLDFGNQTRFLRTLGTLAREGLSVLLTSHVPDHALSSASTAAILKDGRFLRCGTPSEVVTESLIREAYGVAVRVLEVPENPDMRTCVPLPEETLTKPRPRH